MACQLNGVGILQWWCSLTKYEQAAWIQALGSIIAIAVAIYIPYRQRKDERLEQEELNRKIVMSAAANLATAFQYEQVLTDFLPKGDDVISHEFTLDQAYTVMKLRPQTVEAINMALDKSHYFSTSLCEKIVNLSLEAAAYERILEDIRSRPGTSTPDLFLQRTSASRGALSAKFNEVRQMLDQYLPPPA